MVNTNKKIATIAMRLKSSDTSWNIVFKICFIPFQYLHNNDAQEQSSDNCMLQGIHSIHSRINFSQSFAQEYHIIPVCMSGGTYQGVLATFYIQTGSPTKTPCTPVRGLCRLTLHVEIHSSFIYLQCRPQRYAFQIHVHMELCEPLLVGCSFMAFMRKLLCTYMVVFTTTFLQQRLA